MVDLIYSIICNGCAYIKDCDKGYIDECIIEKKDIHEGIRTWLSSFDTSSATKCFEAVNILKMKIVQEEMHEADERLLNSDWGEMEVQE